MRRRWLCVEDGFRKREGGEGREVVVVLGLAGDGLVGVGRCARPGVKDFRFLSIDLYFPSRCFPPLKARVYTTSPCASSPPPLPPYLKLPASPHPIPSANFLPLSLPLSPSLPLPLSLSLSLSLISRAPQPSPVPASSAPFSSKHMYSSSFSLFPPRPRFFPPVKTGLGPCWFCWCLI